MINANNDSYKYELLLVFYCTDVIYCVLIYYVLNYYFLIHASLPSDDFFHPFRDQVYSHKAGDHYRWIGMGKVAYQDMPY